MKKKLGAIASIALAALALVGCGDDGATSAPSGENADSSTYVTDDRDGQTYGTVVIGAQTWMAENLGYEYKVNDSTYGNWCYGNSADGCAKYGRLYAWAAAMDSATTGCGDGETCAASSGKVRGICPDGWHLPSRAEWDILLAAVGGSSVAGTALKASSGWTGDDGSDDYGFSALPSGDRTDDGEMSTAGLAAYFWSSSESAAYRAHSVLLSKGDERARFLPGSKGSGFAVRCVKD
ncbi:MAG: fibrobacter succinogenes major paralogous domain-containing protein [Fibrobacterales bacterium]|nr:fibrobacter succinogenes major paralogous domain-containing protein [Fibrobacterales bacterium]MBP5350616.1 fibrobacter succinogenes major paralogous domain-containing protein [Fibrobacterales bacterium]